LLDPLLGPGRFPVNYAPLLGEFADKLKDIHNTIYWGIFPIPKPTAVIDVEVKWYILPIPMTNGVWNISIPAWHQSGRIIGAVERYSSCSSVDAYPDGEQPMPPVPNDYGEILDDHAEARYRNSAAYLEYAEQFAEWYRHFGVRHTIRNLQHWKALYIALGLPEVWGAMSYLRSLAGLPALAAPEGGGDWSLHQVAAFIGLAIGDRPSTAAPGECVSLRHLQELAGVPPQTSLRELLEM
jgi:hypothetical protein